MYAGNEFKQFSNFGRFALATSKNKKTNTQENSFVPAYRKPRAKFITNTNQKQLYTSFP